jgi:glycosidase
MKTGRVTGNNACTWSPSQNDWYETVKLNYGYDFTTGRREYPHAGAPKLAVPDTWRKMDAVLAHWQELGVDGFRCDMAHMVPPEFWAWVIARARVRNPSVYFIGEAYNNDPMKVEGGYELVSHFHNVMIELLNAGFDAVYDDPAYKTLKAMYDGGAWANDLDGVLAAQGPYVFPGSLRYAENHDEVRLASKGNWGGIGMAVGRAVSGVLYGLSRGPVLIYSGQEVGEPAEGVEGFGGDDGRTTIFDYWSMPEVAKWVNGHRYDGGRLSAEQKALRAYYGRLLKTCGEPAFRDGEFYPLNGVNKDNEAFARLGEQAGGHWLYACVRAEARTHSAYLVVVNLHRSETMRDVRVRLSEEARGALPTSRGSYRLIDHVGGLPEVRVPAAEMMGAGVRIPELPALTAGYFEIRVGKE